MSESTGRHADLLTTAEAARYLGVDRLDKLPDDFRPAPVPFHRSLYHRKDLDAIVERARRLNESKAGVDRGRRIGDSKARVRMAQ